MQASSNVRSQRVLYVLVGHAEVKPFRVEVAATPTFGLGMLLVVRAGHDRKKVLVAADATNVLGRTSARAGDASRNGRGVECDGLLDFNNMPPVVTEIVDVGERNARFVSEIAEPHLPLVEQTRRVREAAIVPILGVAVA